MLATSTTIGYVAVVAVFIAAVPFVVRRKQRESESEPTTGFVSLLL